MNIICPACGGDGKETCNNPDHGFISSLGFRDEGRLGCPVCGHDPKHKVYYSKNGQRIQYDCTTCNGSGRVDQETFDTFCDEFGYDEEPEYFK